MTATKTKHVRHGFGAVRPYVYGHPELVAMIQHAFGAEVLEKHEMGGNAAHIEARIGDAAIVLEVNDPPHEAGTPGSIYVYVEDTDAAYQRALEHGATSIAPPTDKPYLERSAGVKDRYGNTWWISTYQGPEA
jgi:PhnB protein